MNIMEADNQTVNIMEAPLPPAKIKLSEKVEVSPTFRAQFNAWLLSRFGREDDFFPNDHAVAMRNSDTIIVPHGMANELREMLGNQKLSEMKR